MAKQHQNTQAKTRKKSESASRGKKDENNKWTSGGGFQWEGPSIFDEDKKHNDHAPAHEVVGPSEIIDESNSVLAVPMLPGVSMEPIYRQHRSLSFSMGQDPTFFGYNDYSDDDDDNTQTRYKNSLETMAEEDENVLLADDEMDFGPYRMRSKSSGAALSMLSSSQQGYLMNRYVRRGSAEQQGLVDDDERRQWNGDASSSQDHMDSMDTKDPVRRLAEQIEAMQLQQQQQQHMPYSNAPSSYPMPIPPPPDMYSHLHHPTAPPNTGSYYHAEHVEADPRMFQEGKGVGLHQLPPDTLLYMIEFKAGRTDFFYIPSQDPMLQVHVGDLVIVEADRGKDLGKVAMENLTHDQILQMKKQQQHDSPQDDSSNPSSPNSQDDIKPSEIQIKRIYRQAMSDEISVLLDKGEDENRALSVCQQKTKQRKLPMEVVDAEYQWDRRKLTFYFVAERRIDFRELVRELFKIYKTRIWMCAVNPTNTN